MIKIEVDTVGGPKVGTEALRREIQDVVQQRAREGWTLRSSTSRGGHVYLIFARKEKP